MDNQDVPENQVIIINESEKNSRLVSLEGHNSEKRKSSAKEGQESSSNLISKLPSKKRNVERENLLQIAAPRGKSLQKLHYTQRIKGNMVRTEGEIILQLLVIHPHLMETFQMTRNMQDLK